MDTFRVALFGHREFDGHRIIEKDLPKILGKLLREKEYIEILIGRNGEFDIFSASVIKKFKRLHSVDNLDLNVVIPYVTKDVEFYERYYDNIILPETVEHFHPKGRIEARNKWMIEQADLIICYVNQSSGGAYKALEYARAVGRYIINLAY